MEEYWGKGQVVQLYFILFIRQVTLSASRRLAIREWVLPMVTLFIPPHLKAHLLILFYYPKHKPLDQAISFIKALEEAISSDRYIRT